MHAEWWGAYVWSECLGRVIREGRLQGGGGFAGQTAGGACLGQPSEEGFWAGLGRGGGVAIIVSGAGGCNCFWGHPCASFFGSFYECTWCSPPTISGTIFSLD